MIVADTGGIVALLDADDQFHASVRDLFDERRGAWLLPWAILPEVDYLTATRLSSSVEAAFVKDLAEGLYRVDANLAKDLPRADELVRRYSSLGLGLVDAVVMAQAERHKAEVIVTTDGRHFRAVKLKIDPPPRLVPIDSPA